jgi:hypothetical protein
VAIYSIIVLFKDSCAVNIDSNIYMAIVLSTFADCLLYKVLARRFLWVLYFVIEIAEVID